MANEEVGNLVAKVTLDSTGFQNGISGLNRQLKVVQSDFKAASATLDDFGKGTDGLKLKAASLGQQIDIQKQKVAALESAYKQSASAKGADAKATQDLQIKMNLAKTQLGGMETEFKKTTDEIKAQSTVLGRLKQDYQQSFDEAKRSMGGTAAQVRTAGTALTAAGAGLAAGLGGAVKEAADFDGQMSKVKALSQATAGDFGQLRNQAIKLGADTSFSASQAAEGMQQLAAAGFNAQQIMAAMPGVLAAAAASGEDMTLVSETMASTLNAFGLAASQSGHIADVLAASANMSAIGIGDMSLSLKYAGPPAKALGFSLESVSAAIVEMGNAGIKGEQAGTTLRQAMLRLVDPPKEAKQEFDSLRVSILDANNKMKPFSEIIAQLSDGMKDMTGAQKAAALANIFGTEAVSGMMVVVDQGPQKFREFTDSLENSTGSAQTAANVMKDNLKGSVEQLTGSVESAAISMGTSLSPKIREAAEGITDLVGEFTALPPETQATVVEIAAATAAFALLGGPLLIVVGMLPAIGAGFAAMVSPVGLAVGALAGIGITAVAVANEMSQEAIPAVDRFGDSVSDSTKKAIESFVALNDQATLELKELSFSGQDITNDMATKISDNFAKMKDQTIAKLTEQKNEVAKTLQEMFVQGTDITGTEQAKMIEAATDGYNKQIQLVTDTQQKISDILKSAAADHRALTGEEKVEVNQLQQEMLKFGIDQLTSSAQEQADILERLRTTTTAASARQAAEIVQESIKQRDKTVEIAKDEYNKRIDAANMLLAQGTQDATDMANKIISEAERQKDYAVQSAQETHRQVVAEAQHQAREHVAQVDWETGEVKKRYETLQGIWQGAADFIGKLVGVGAFYDKTDSSNLRSSVSAFASGTRFAPGGMAIVGERGPELVTLPRGSQVSTAAETDSILKYPEYIQADIYLDGKAIASVTSKAQYNTTRTRSRSLGVNPV